MGKYREIRKVIMDMLSDQQWHKLDELQTKCEETGITFEGGRGPVYNVTHDLKKKGKIEGNGMGEYKMHVQSMEYCNKGDVVETSKNQETQLIESIKTIETHLMIYKNFDWINCSEYELNEVRSNVTRVLDLAQIIEKEFKKA